MESVIEKLWGGELDPANSLGDKYDKIVCYSSLIEECLENLRKRLDSEGCEILKRYEDANWDYLFLENENAFKKGFSLALKLSAEAFLRE